MVRQIRIVAWIAVVILSVTIAAAMYMRAAPENPRGPAEVKRDHSFVLVNHLGEQVNSQKFAGQYMLVYFGFTFCPDACPTTMAKLTLALNQLAEDGYDTGHFQPVFITVDPDRDTPEQLGFFRENFHPSLVALGGTKDQIDSVVMNYGSYYNIDRGEADTEDYAVQHMDVIFVIDPDGRRNQILTVRDEVGDVVAKLAALSGS